MFRFLREKLRFTDLTCFFFVASLFVALSSYGQSFYSTNPEYLLSKPERNNLITAYRSQYPDTSINNEYNYSPRNFMGNLGLPSPNYILRYGTANAGFTFFQPPTQLDRFKESDIEYFRSKGPYARLTGIAGTKQLQMFKMIFTTTVKNVNFALKFNRYTSQGFYLKQQTYSNNFFLTSNYSTKSKRFGYYFYVLNNSNKNQESNGIKDGQLNDSTVLLTKELLAVNTYSANRDNRETKVMLNPWFRLNAHSDSLRRFDHYLQLKSKLSFNLYRYSDNLVLDSAYTKRYQKYMDTVQTFDSSHVTQSANELAYALISTNKKLSASIAYKNEINRVFQYGYHTFTNHIATADFVFRSNLKEKDTLIKKKRSFETAFNAQYIFAGNNSANYKAESQSMLVLNGSKRNTIYLNALVERRNADYIYNNWLSNHFEWFNNGFTVQEQFQIKTGANFGRHFNISVFYQAINHFLYFDRNALPAQFNSVINNAGFSVAYEAIFFKHLGVGFANTLQNTSNKEYMRLPPNITTAKLFFNASLFKNNMQLQIGGQLQVYQSFKGYAYMAPTQVYYLQDATSTGTYPYLDLYLNARIRPVSVFLKIENALQGYSGHNYFFVPGYYQPDRAFRFGISWMFFD